MKPIDNKKYTGIWDEDKRLYRITRKSDSLVGGWIARENNLSEYGACFVYDNAQVYDNARIYDNSEVSGNARVYDNARVYGNARVTGNAEATKDVFNLNYGLYNIIGTDYHLRIRCKQYTYQEWWNFTDEEIDAMDDSALEWWYKWKPILMAIFKEK